MSQLTQLAATPCKPALRVHRSPLFLVFVLAWLGLEPVRASAFVWPDVAERVERDLSADDPATRRMAARDLSALGPARGGPLAVAAL
ncbi:MAG TPA: hypothetical protein VN894_20940, partial [Polyangiaceae bacterium]|nr:hypothetical protein [Polyangiaceae bacterium]